MLLQFFLFLLLFFSPVTILSGNKSTKCSTEKKINPISTRKPTPPHEKAQAIVVTRLTFHMLATKTTQDNEISRVVPGEPFIIDDPTYNQILELCKSSKASAHNMITEGVTNSTRMTITIEINYTPKK